MTALRLRLEDERGGSSLTPALLDRLHDALRRDDGALAIVLDGGPRVYCSGLDLGELTELGRREPGSPERFDRSRGSGTNRESAAIEQALRRFGSLLDAIGRAARPVIAVVDGAAMGGGVGLIAACDFVIASRRATFSLPEAFLGLIPAMIYPFVARRVGSPRAKWMALAGSSLSAEEALRTGLVDRVSDDPETALADCLKRLGRTDPRSLAQMKELIARHEPVSEAYRSDAAARFALLLQSGETRDRLARFLDGGTPWPESP